MAKRLTLEERAERKFPLDSYASEKERNSILAMRKAWVKVEQVKAEENQKKKRRLDKDALRLGKQLQKSYPDLTLEAIARALETEQQVIAMARLTYFKEDEIMLREGVKEIYECLIMKYKKVK